MSGGSYNYIYSDITQIRLHGVGSNPRRAAFQQLLLLVANAMHDIEWVDSCDTSPGDENEAIDACFAFLSTSPEIIAKAHAFDELKSRLQSYFSSL